MSQKLVSLQIYLNAERDEVILAWLAEQKNKSAAVREILLTYIQSLSGDSCVSQARTSATIDSETIHQAINTALAEQFDLNMIRQVVEAAISMTGPSAPISQTDEEEEEAEVLLATLDNGLIKGQIGLTSGL